MATFESAPSFSTRSNDRRATASPERSQAFDVNRALVARVMTMLGQLDASFLPSAESMSTRPPHRILATLLFTDIVDSTGLAERLRDSEWTSLMSRHRAIVRQSLAECQGREIDCAGDGFFAAFDRPSLAIASAASIRHALHGLGMEVRAGVHAGECEAVEGRINGVSVHVAARIAATALAGEILVSAAVRDLLAGSEIRFGQGTLHHLKGLSEARELFPVEFSPRCRDFANRCQETLAPVSDQPS